MDFDCDCDGFGIGWIFPVMIVGKILGEVFDRPRPTAWPYPPPPQAPPADNPPARAATATLNGVACSGCNRSVSADFQFCPHCGTRVAPPSCRYCGQQLDKKMAYCPHCGGPAKT